jgi:hypothetical protein
MTATTTDLNAVKSQAEEIVASGADVRRRLAEVVTRAAAPVQQSGAGLVALTRAVMDGAREGLARSVPEDRDDVLRQVVDALGDGLSQTALAARLAIQEAAGSSPPFTREDLARLRDDLTAARTRFAEMVSQRLTTCKDLTTGQIAAARTHAGRVAERLGPAFTQALDAVRQHPASFVREGVHAGVGMAQGAAGALFQALARKLQQAGDELRREASVK